MTDKNIYDKNIIEFVTVGVEFCSFIERANDIPRTDFIDTAVKLLPLLYLKAALLPESEKEFDSMTEHFVTEEVYEYIRTLLCRKLGEDDSYLEVFHEDMQYSETPVVANISEDLTDIYQDIKDFVSTFSLGNEESSREALDSCRENFAAYWGQKLVNVLRALHHLRFDPNAEREEDDAEKESDEWS